MVILTKRSERAVRRTASWVKRNSLNLSNGVQGVLASGVAVSLNTELGKLVAGAPTIYDKLIDAEYIATSIGGANHRLIDGSHTLWGASQAIRDGSLDDSIVQQGLGYLQALLRDATTAKGLPLVTWDKGTYEQFSGFLKSHLGIPRSWSYDILSYNPAEILGATVGALALALSWSRADAEQFGRIAGGTGLAALASANPLLLIVAVVALAKAFMEAKAEGRLGEAVDGLARGLATSGAALGATALVLTAGGPAGLALIAGLVASLVVAKLAGKVSVSEAALTVSKQAKAAAGIGAELVAHGARSLSAGVSAIRNSAESLASSTKAVAVAAATTKAVTTAAAAARAGVSIAGDAAATAAGEVRAANSERVKEALRKAALRTRSWRKTSSICPVPMTA